MSVLAETLRPPPPAAPARLAGRRLLLIGALPASLPPCPGWIAPYDPARLRHDGDPASRRASRIPSAPTISAATFFRASSGRRASTCDRDLRDRLSRRLRHRSSAPSSATTAAGSTCCSAASSISSSPFRSWSSSSPSWPCSGPASLNMYIAVSVVGWVFYARLMRGRGDGAEAGRLRGRRPRARLWRRCASSSATCCPTAIGSDHRLLDDRHGARHPARLEPRLSRPRRPAADRRMGRADRRRQELHQHGAGGSRSFRASPSCSPASASACSATASPTCCDAGGDDGRGAPLLSVVGPAGLDSTRRGGRWMLGRRRRSAGRRRRGARPRRRIRLGQEPDAALDRPPPAAAAAASPARCAGAASTCWRCPSAS